MTRLTAALVVLIAAGGSAHALEVLNAGGMSCSRLQAAVERSGRAVVQWTSAQVPGLPLTGTFVASNGYCAVGQMTTRRSVRSADSPSCPLLQCQRRIRGTR